MEDEGEAPFGSMEGDLERLPMPPTRDIIVVAWRLAGVGVEMWTLRGRERKSCSFMARAASADS